MMERFCLKMLLIQSPTLNGTTVSTSIGHKHSSTVHHPCVGERNDGQVLSPESTPTVESLTDDALVATLSFTSSICSH